MSAATEDAYDRGYRGGAQRIPEFRPDGEPDELRDAYYGSMTTHGYMYFAIPGEQPIHLGDDEARYILAWLSERRA